MEASRAVPAPLGQNNSPAEVEPEFDHIQLRTAELLGQNKSRFEVARILEHHLLTPYQRKLNYKQRRRYALRKIRRWQKNKRFRDIVYEAAVTKLDSRTPAILEGVADRAEMGRVDAAKLGLELSGRYTPKGSEQATSVQIVVAGVPRPQSEVIEGTVVEEEDGGPDGP